MRSQETTVPSKCALRLGHGMFGAMRPVQVAGLLIGAQQGLQSACQGSTYTVRKKLDPANGHYSGLQWPF